jgi:DNA processing protein
VVRHPYSLLLGCEGLEDVVVVLALHRLVWGGGWGLIRGALGVGSVDGFIERALADGSALWWAGVVLRARFGDILEGAVRVAGELEREGAGFAPFHSPGYPEALRRYRLGGPLHRPLGLFTKPPAGLHGRFVGVVGTRSCTRWGRRVAWETGRLVAQAGFALVTGLAECIDASAALGALEAGGLAVGVRPWLKPLQLPGESRRLLEAHGDRVILASEHYTRPREASPGKLYYLRNRVIAGMSDLVVAVEARPGGGAMHQAEWALKRGRRLAVLEHPEAGSDYHKAYGMLVGAGATALKAVEDLRGLLEELRGERATTSRPHI